MVFSSVDDNFLNKHNLPGIDKLPKSFSQDLDSDDDRDSDDDDLKDEENYINNDPIRKFQISYNKSLCLSNKYPEISSLDDVSEVEIAPGEGKRPIDILRENDWDIKAFPHLHNLNGRHGKDEKRKVFLSDQNYFIQRILNKDLRFAKTPTYIYAAIGYLEKKTIQRNINIAGTRGKIVGDIDGGETTYELDDGYTVLDDVRNTPRYWKKAKYEMIAKLENLGAFQIFYLCRYEVARKLCNRLER